MKKIPIILVLSAALALFWVVFNWGFWDRGVYALGLNAFVFLSLLMLLFVWQLYREEKISKRDLSWITPLWLISFSFILYDNPFLKVISILIFLSSFAFFYNYAWLENKHSRSWDFSFFSNIFIRIMSFLGKIVSTLALYVELIIPASGHKRKVTVKIILGILLLVIIALTVFIPLLSSADSIFADKVKVVHDWVREIFSVPIVYKIINFIIFSVIMSTALFAWSKKLDYKPSERMHAKVDSIISGIVLGGILLIYLLFLWVQLERLWVGSLPFDFYEVEELVKSGFWQLLFLSIINIVIYFFTYRKTHKIVQWILTAFTISSLLLLCSAAYRMGLYVTYYGLSYEKFFASYTVIYCTILFAWLIFRLFVKKSANILKFLLMLFIWMYAVLTVFPVEQFILKSNVSLSKLENSHIRLFELSILSPDALSLVKKYQERGLLQENSNYFVRSEGLPSPEQPDWTPWILRQEQEIFSKKWYERNILNMLYLRR